MKKLKEKKSKTSSREIIGHFSLSDHIALQKKFDSLFEMRKISKLHLKNRKLHQKSFKTQSLNLTLPFETKCKSKKISHYSFVSLSK